MIRCSRFNVLSQLGSDWYSFAEAAYYCHGGVLPDQPSKQAPKNFLADKQAAKRAKKAD